MPGPPNGNEILNAALAKLRADDVRVQQEGVAAVIRVGKAAIPALLPSLENDVAEQRAQAMYALAQIADPATAGVFQRALQDQDERVRAYAAEGLAHIAHEDALAACLQTLNDAPDEAHMDMTPSVQALGQMGMQAVPALIDLLMNENENSRLHAQRALEMILNQRHGFHPGQGFPTPEAEEQARAEWQAHGDYDYSTNAATRAAAVVKWRHWLETAEK